MLRASCASGLVLYRNGNHAVQLSLQNHEFFFYVRCTITQTIMHSETIQRTSTAKGPALVKKRELEKKELKEKRKEKYYQESNSRHQK